MISLMTDIKPKYICEIEHKEGYRTGILRDYCTDEEREARRRLLKIFESDCQTILEIFTEYWKDFSNASDEKKAAFLKHKMLQAFPGLFRDWPVEDHVLHLMDWLMQEGHLLLPKPNRKHLHAHWTIGSDIMPGDCFVIWTVDDPDAWFKSKCQEYEEMLNYKYESPLSQNHQPH